MSVTWLDLPERCLALVFGKLQAKDAATARLVCSHWARVALINCTQVSIRKRDGLTGGLPCPVVCLQLKYVVEP